MWNAECQCKRRAANDPSLQFRIPHPAFRTPYSAFCLGKRSQLDAVFGDHGVPPAVQKRSWVEIHAPVPELLEGGAAGVGEDHQAEVGAPAEKLARERGLGPAVPTEESSFALVLGGVEADLVLGPER